LRTPFAQLEVVLSVYGKWQFAGLTPGGWSSAALNSPLLTMGFNADRVDEVQPREVT